MTALKYRFADALLASAGIREPQSLLVAGELLDLLRELIVECQDCNGAGDDLCDVCDGTGRRAGGRCRKDVPIGSGTVECPTCCGDGYVTRDNAESMGWSK